MSEEEKTLIPIITANFKPFRLVQRGTGVPGVRPSIKSMTELMTT
jgi:hypothetical protein